MDFGARLRALRKKKGWTQAQLAQQAGLVRPVIGRLEAGIRGGEHLTVGVVKRLAHTHGVTLDHLVGMYAAAATPAQYRGHILVAIGHQ